MSFLARKIIIREEKKKINIYKREKNRGMSKIGATARASMARGSKIILSVPATRYIATCIYVHRYIDRYINV